MLCSTLQRRFPTPNEDKDLAAPATAGRAALTYEISQQRDARARAYYADQRRRNPICRDREPSLGLKVSLSRLRDVDGLSSRTRARVSH